MWLGSTGNYFQGSGDQPYSYGGIWEALQEVKKMNLNNLTLKEKPLFRLTFFLN